MNSAIIMTAEFFCEIVIKKFLLWKRKTIAGALTDNSYFVNLTFTSYVLKYLLSVEFEQTK